MQKKKCEEEKINVPVQFDSAKQKKKKKKKRLNVEAQNEMIFL